MFTQYCLRLLLTAQLWSYLKGFRQQRLPGNQLYPYLYQAHSDATEKQQALSIAVAKSAADLNPIVEDGIVADQPPKTATPTKHATPATASSTAEHCNWSTGPMHERITPTAAAPVELEEIVIGDPIVAKAAVQDERASDQRPFASSLLASLDCDYNGRISESCSATTTSALPSPAACEQQSQADAALFMAANQGEHDSATVGSETAAGNGISVKSAPEVRKPTGLQAHKRQSSIFDYLKPA